MPMGGLLCRIHPPSPRLSPMLAVAMGLSLKQVECRHIYHRLFQWSTRSCPESQVSAFQPVQTSPLQSGTVSGDKCG